MLCDCAKWVCLKVLIVWGVCFEDKGDGEKC